MTSLRKIREKKASTTRKLIGHSGPVYALSFDPINGSAGPPKHLLSASADTTVRLWSMDTLTNVVAYRGHQNPVWDVKWNPMGVYFATASRDRTARLWSTDRTTCLRVYAGHLSDVDVRISLSFCGVKFHLQSVSAISSELAVPSDGLQRLDGKAVGCPTWSLHESLHRTSGCYYISRHEPRWSFPC